MYIALIQEREESYVRCLIDKVLYEQTTDPAVAVPGLAARWDHRRSRDRMQV